MVVVFSSLFGRCRQDGEKTLRDTVTTPTISGDGVGGFTTLPFRVEFGHNVPVQNIKDRF